VCARNGAPNTVRFHASFLQCALLSDIDFYYLSFFVRVPYLLTIYRFGSGGNASAHSGAGLNAKRLEESDELKHVKVDKSLSKAIMQARTAKKLSQKELATKINEKPQVVGEYESGKAIPNPQIIGKIERALGCKLPRPTKKAAPKTAGTKPGIGGRTTGGGSGPVRGAGPPRKR
jgi:putative transcription factor